MDFLYSNGFYFQENIEKKTRKVHIKGAIFQAYIYKYFK